MTWYLQLLAFEPRHRGHGACLVAHNRLNRLQDKPTSAPMKSWLTAKCLADRTDRWTDRRTDSAIKLRQRWASARSFRRWHGLCQNVLSRTMGAVRSAHILRCLTSQLVPLTCGPLISTVLAVYTFFGFSTVVFVVNLDPTLRTFLFC